MLLYLDPSDPFPPLSPQFALSFDRSKPTFGFHWISIRNQEVAAGGDTMLPGTETALRKVILEKAFSEPRFRSSVAATWSEGEEGLRGQSLRLSSTRCLQSSRR